MLSHNNVASNVDAVNDVLDLKAEDTLIGVLPFFHSFGYTITLWLPLCTAPATVFHFNPLDARTVSKLCRRHSATIIAATPTFLRTYLEAVRSRRSQDSQSGHRRSRKAAGCPS